MRGRFACAALLLVPVLAWAQTVRPPNESVTVTGIKSREALEKFVGSLAAPTRLTGKMARWMSPVCPAVVGVPREFAKFIDRRLRDVAAQVGAPVSDKARCRTNLVIVFSARPQALADDIRNRQPALLGYADNREQEKELATVTHPIQAWYMTATRDVAGSLQVDNAKPAGLINRMEFPCPPPMCSDGKIILYPPRVATTTGLRLGDGLRSEIYNIVIVADRGKLLDYEMGELSDYIAMLGLTQLSDQGPCHDLPSISNLLAEACSTKSPALTDADLAFLRGLYRMSPEMALGVQKDQVSYEMEQALKGH